MSTSTRYLSIVTQGDLLPLGTDMNNRSMFSLNFRTHTEGFASKLEEDVARLIYDQTLGTLGTDMFIGAAAVLPTSGAGPFIRVMRTGGIDPHETHNGDKYGRASFQIIVLAVSYTVARNRAIAIREALDGVRDVTVVVA